MSEIDKKVSDQLVRLIQIVFGFVLAQSLGRYEVVVLHPWKEENRLAAFALLTVYITTVLSWMDWHLTMVLRPYNLNPKTGNSVLEEIRVFSDLFIVSIYAYVLLAIKHFSDDLSMDATPYLLGFVFIFIGYSISGILRMIRHGSMASNLSPIFCFIVLYIFVFYGYKWLLDKVDRILLNYLAVAATLVLMLSYRVMRRVIRRNKQKMKAEGLHIGLDVDGVLANQISGIIPRIKHRLGIDITYEMVTDWRLPLGESDIAKEISSAMEDSDYVLSMPVHCGAKEVTAKLYRENDLKIITARPSKAQDWTIEWLERHGLAFDSISSVNEKDKSLFASDVLVDDYLGNIIEYLQSTNGIAILVDQPWNRERDLVQQFLEAKRLYITQGICEVPSIIDSIKQNRK